VILKAHTSVGPAAIGRFLRPVSYQDVPDRLLPAGWVRQTPFIFRATWTASTGLELRRTDRLAACGSALYRDPVPRRALVVRLVQVRRRGGRTTSLDKGIGTSRVAEPRPTDRRGSRHGQDG